MSRIALFFTLLISLSILPGQAPAQLLSRDSLLNDAEQLARAIEDVHPDPFLAGGGKIAFHRQLQHIMEAIPDSGMTTYEFYRLLEPLLASVGDAHTMITDPYSTDPYSPKGIPLYFETADNGLYVAAVFNNEYRSLLGAQLKSIEGLSIDDIVERYRRRRAADNDYFLYRCLGGQGALWNAHSLKALIPEWVRPDGR